MKDLEQIAILENEVEAGLVESYLEAHDVPHMICSFYDAAYDGIFQAQKGWGALWSSPENRETVLSVIGEVRAAAEETCPESEDEVL